MNGTGEKAYLSHSEHVANVLMPEIVQPDNLVIFSPYANGESANVGDHEPQVGYAQYRQVDVTTAYAQSTEENVQKNSVKQEASEAQ